MRFASRPLPSLFMERPNRFLGRVQLGGEYVECFIPNPGRMTELLRPGSRVFLLEKIGEMRKTDYDMVLVEHRGAMVSIDSRIPNRILAEAIDAGRIPQLRGFTVSRTEPLFDDSRFDLLLKGKEGQMLLEAKSCTLVREGVALFPDAPTERGARHARTLVEALRQGRSAIFFVIQRGDALEFRPYEEKDHGFTRSLRYAASSGVEVYAYTSDVSLNGVDLSEPIPVNL